jgi:EAL domain-containing protein (putative c-di-GMP-specific phosphodiesterase class I)
VIAVPGTGTTGQLSRLLAPGALHTLFQPIYRLDGDLRSVEFVEALTRGPAGRWERPGVLFGYARQRGAEPSMDRAAFRAALSAAAALPRRVCISINVHAATLERDPSFPAFTVATAIEAGIEPRRLIVEIVEHAPSLGGPNLKSSLQALRTAGVRIAVDDVGLGHSNFQMLLECAPEFVKVDAVLVRNCDQDDRRRAILESIVDLSTRLGAVAVAEGVETHQELEAGRRCGFNVFQGFLFARPAAASALVAAGV